MDEKRICTGMGRYVPGLGKELAALRKHKTFMNCWIGMMGDTAVIAYEGTFRADKSCEDEPCLTLFENPGATLLVDQPTAEKVDMKSDAQSWENEGGHMSCTSGRIISVPGDKPFKVVMSRERGETSERLFATMREAEAFIRRNTPRPPERRTTYDRQS